MRRARAALAASAALAACVIFALPASAKGPSQGLLTGPELAAPIPLSDPGSRTIGADLSDVVMESGFFNQAFGSQPHRLLQEWSGALGPRYTITYTMSLDGPRNTIVQYLYPYAVPRPVTFMPAHQAFWGTQETVGGYVQAPRSFRRTLVRIGLPATASPSEPATARDTPGDVGGSRGPSWLMGWIGIAAIASGLVALRLRRSRSAAT